MSTELTAFTAHLPTKLRGQKVENELSAGIAAGFGIVGYKGKVWSIRYQGNTTPLMREDGDGPKNSIEVVVVKASQHIAKIFYDGKYVEGSTAAPDCWSTNGVVPDPGATKKQAASCASCPKNAWGSRITDAGKQGKACADSKRLAVVPAEDLRNEAFGGPMLLRVPAASLKELAAFGDRMQSLGFPGYAFVTRISFDPESAFPQFKFAAIRPVSDAEFDVVEGLRSDPRVTRILAEGSEIVAAAPAAAPAQPSPFEQPAPAPKALQAPTPKVEATPEPSIEEQIAALQEMQKKQQAATPKAKQGPPPVTTTVTNGAAPAAGGDEVKGAGSSFENELDKKLASLMPSLS